MGEGKVYSVLQAVELPEDDHDVHLDYIFILTKHQFHNQIWLSPNNFHDSLKKLKQDFGRVPDILSEGDDLAGVDEIF
jgi:hypothetical protein